MDEMEPTAEQKKELIVQAIEILGFAENGDNKGMYSRDQGNIRSVVDLTAGRSAYLYNIVKKCRIEDDESGTLAALNQALDEAETGAMPGRSEPDIVIGGSLSNDDPAKYPNDMDIKTNSQNALAPDRDNAPAELIHNTAAPSPFQPKGMMIMDIQPGLAEEGAIKIGGKGEERKGQSGQPYRLPVKYDHFMILTKLKDDAGNFIVDPIMKRWGFSGMVEDGPKELDIYLLYDNPTSNFLTSYRQYKGGKCLCSGDGIEAVKADETKIQCNTETCPIFKSRQCKPNGILSVILKDAPALGGVYKFRTTSFNSIRQILSSMFFIQSATGGHLANIPLKMTLTPKTVNPIGSPTAQTVYIVNIIFPGNVEDLHKKTLQLVKERASMRQEILAIEAQAKLAICAPETEGDIQEIESEFYPDNDKAGVV